jgi:peptidylprolyl isomerase
MKKLLSFMFFSIICALFIFGCSTVEKAESGDTIRLNYTGKLEDGTIFDSSEDREPIEFVIGGGAVIPGLENGIIGMTVTETKTITIPMEEAYGPKRPEMIMKAPKDKLPQDMEIEVGRQLESRQPDGRIMYVTIIDVAEDTVMLDANHPLAGKTLIFEVEIMEIIKGQS